MVLWANMFYERPTDCSHFNTWKLEEEPNANAIFSVQVHRSVKQRVSRYSYNRSYVYAQNILYSIEKSDSCCVWLLDVLAPRLWRRAGAIAGHRVPFCRSLLGGTDVPSRELTKRSRALSNRRRRLCFYLRFQFSTYHCAVQPCR